MKMLSVAVEDSFAKAIDELISSTGRYSSRSEFIKDSMRKNYDKNVELSENVKKFRDGIIELRKLAISRGMKPGMPTREERDRHAREYLKKNGFD
ncbi:MAG: hypothetical protein ABH821_00920 [archaeon]